MLYFWVYKQLVTFVLLVAFTVSVILSGAGASSAFADVATPELPVSQSLFAHGYFNNTVGTINTSTSEVALLGEPANIGTELAEGAGYDSVTGKTWIMQDCELWSLNAEGSTVFAFPKPQYVFAEGESPLEIFACWAFTTRSDGTAYLTGRPPGGGPDSALLFQVSLITGEIISAVNLDVDESTVHPTTGSQISRGDLSPTDIAFNPNTQDLWVVGYEGYVYRLNTQSGAIDRIFSGLVSAREWSWGMAVDSHNVLWLASTANDQTFTLVTLSPDSSWERHNFPVLMLADTSAAFGTDAMWIAPSQSLVPATLSETISQFTPEQATTEVQELANTGSRFEWLLTLGFFSLLLGIGHLLHSQTQRNFPKHAR